MRFSLVPTSPDAPLTLVQIFDPSKISRDVFLPEGVMRYSAQLIVILLASTTLIAQTQSRATSAASYLDRGNDSYKKGDVERAMADYDLAIATDPRLAAAYY